MNHEHAYWSDDEVFVLMPRSVIERALHKARIVYVRVAVEAGQDPGGPGECWTEFELLADALLNAGTVKT